MLGPQAGKDTDGAGACVLGQRSGNNLHRIGHGLVGPLLHALNRLSQLAQLDGNRHFESATTGGQSRMEDDVSGDRHGVLQVAFNLVDDILRRTTEQDRTSLGVLALGEEGEVFVADLFNLEQATLRAHIRLLKIVDPVDNGGASGSGNTVVVRLPDTAESGDVRLHQEVLRKVYQETH